MPVIEVACNGMADDGWTCAVTISEGDREVGRYRVRVNAVDLARLAPGATVPDELVGRSFMFLLERESPRSILRDFDLAVIGTYFADYESEIRRG